MATQQRGVRRQTAVLRARRDLETAAKMTTSTTTSGHLVRPSGRNPKTFDKGRVCTDPDCDTKLSTYNRNDTCFRHSPIRYPRTRGRPRSD